MSHPPKSSAEMQGWEAMRAATAKQADQVRAVAGSGTPAMLQREIALLHSMAMDTAAFGIQASTRTIRDSLDRTVAAIDRAIAASDKTSRDMARWTKWMAIGSIILAVFAAPPNRYRLVDAVPP